MLRPDSSLDVTSLGEEGLQRFVHRLWLMGWDAVRDIVQYIVAGAVIVLPVWFVMRLFNMRGAK